MAISGASRYSTPREEFDRMNLPGFRRAQYFGADVVWEAVFAVSEKRTDPIVPLAP